MGYNNDKTQVGVSAQEVEAVLPEIVTQAPVNNEYKTIYYDKLIPLLIEGIKTLNEKIDKLENKVDNLKNKNNIYKWRKSFKLVIYIH